MSQKRVAVVLASLVGTMTISAGALLLMEDGRDALGTNLPSAFVLEPAAIMAQLQPTSPLQPSRWNYIIIYESGDVGASAQTLTDGRLTGGDLPSANVRPKANFHVVIDGPLSGNGTLDGKPEVGENWKNQSMVAGAPFALWPDPRSHLYTPYNSAVGVCLVGDLNRSPISEAQHQNLLQIVRELQRLTNIPKDHILFQWNCPNARPASAAQLAYDQRFRADLN